LIVSSYYVVLTIFIFHSQFVAAFERVVAGWVRLTVSGPKGSLVTVHYGEKLNPDGTVIYQGAVLILSRTIRILMELRCTDLQHYYANNFQTDRFWLAGTGAPEVFEPQFSYKGMRSCDSSTDHIK
jgi:alpha-L-rhamnosidase